MIFAKAILDSLIKSDPMGFYGSGADDDPLVEVRVDARIDFHEVSSDLEKWLEENPGPRESILKLRVLYLEAGIKTYLEDNHTVPRDEFFKGLLAGTIGGDQVKADKE
jgi:hypothetical protein